VYTETHDNVLDRDGVDDGLVFHQLVDVDIDALEIDASARKNDHPSYNDKADDADADVDVATARDWGTLLLCLYDVDGASEHKYVPRVSAELIVARVEVDVHSLLKQRARELADAAGDANGDGSGGGGGVGGEDSAAVRAALGRTTIVDFPLLHTQPSSSKASKVTPKWSRLLPGGEKKRAATVCHATLAYTCEPSQFSLLSRDEWLEHRRTGGQSTKDRADAASKAAATSRLEQLQRVGGSLSDDDEDFRKIKASPLSSNFTAASLSSTVRTTKFSITDARRLLFVHCTGTYSKLFCFLLSFSFLFYARTHTYAYTNTLTI
jgi:hypothetical protein